MTQNKFQGLILISFKLAVTSIRQQASKVQSVVDKCFTVRIQKLSGSNPDYKITYPEISITLSFPPGN
jgi:hypothetical protein